MQNNSDSKKNSEVTLSQRNNESITGKRSDLQKGTLWSKSWVYILLLGIITVIVFQQFFLSNQMLYSSDQIGGLDSKVYYKDALVNNKQFPFWFNSRLGGMPTNDATFGDTFYPISIISTYLLPIARAISFKMIFHVFLAGIFFFLMLRKGFGISPLVSLTGAIFYMLNPEFFSHIYPGHDGKMYVIALLPFVIWRLKVLMDTPSVFNVSLLSVGVGLSLLTSHVQMVYFVLWGMFFYWIVASVHAYRQHDNKKIIWLGLSFWSAIFIGIGIALIQFLPSYLYVQNAYSVRGVAKGFEFASSWSLHWSEFLSMWVPEFGNSLDYYWGQNPFKLNSEYAGAMAIFLCTLSIISKPNIWRIFWGSVAVFAILFSLGAHTPVFHLAYYLVPGVKKFRACSMIMFWFSFSTIFLASLTLKDIVAGKFSSFSNVLRDKWVKGIYIALGFCALLAILFSVQGFVEGLFGGVLVDGEKRNIFEVNFSKNFVPFLWLWFVFIVAVLVALVNVIKGKLKPVYFVLLVLFIGSIDLLRVDMQFVKLFDPAPYFLTEPALVPLQAEMKETPFRCFSLPGSLPQNGEGIHGLEGVNGFHDNELRWYREFRGEQDNNYLRSVVDVDAQGQAFLSVDKLSSGSPLLNIANVKYMMVRNQNDLLAIKNVNALGRVSFASKYVVLDSTQVLQSLMRGEYDYRTTVALEKEPLFKPTSTGNGDFSSLVTKWERYTPNYRKVAVTAPGDGFLRVSEVYYPGWEIRVDSKKVDVYRADLSWMAVPITKGEHLIEMIPHSIDFGKIASVSFSLIGLIFLYWAVIFVQRLVIRKRT